MKLLGIMEKVEWEENSSQKLPDGSPTHYKEDLNPCSFFSALYSIFFQHQVIQAAKNTVVGARDLQLQDAMLKERLNFAPLWGGPANAKAMERNMKHK